MNASFVYDRLGRREAKTINGSLTEFLYDHLNPAQETSGTTVIANILGGLRVDQIFRRTEVPTGIISDILPDALGSSVALTDTAGLVQTEYSYEFFGKTTSTGTSNGNSYQYAGRENDGMERYYYRARFHDTAFKRFISEDPLSISSIHANAPGDTRAAAAYFAAQNSIVSPNVYLYGDNEPVSKKDPLGLFSCG